MEQKITNANILCLVRLGSGRNKLVQLLIRSQNSGGWTIRSLAVGVRLCDCNTTAYYDCKNLMYCTQRQTTFCQRRSKQQGQPSNNESSVKEPEALSIQQPTSCVLNLSTPKHFNDELSPPSSNIHQCAVAVVAV